MLGLPCHYNASQHKLINPEMLNWCRRQTSDDRLKKKLFMYYHRLYGTFVVGLWVGEPRRWFVDLLNLVASLWIK